MNSCEVFYINGFRKAEVTTLIEELDRVVTEIEYRAAGTGTSS